jgi:hypothetical protein
MVLYFGVVDRQEVECGDERGYQLYLDCKVKPCLSDIKHNPLITTLLVFILCVNLGGHWLKD